MNEIEKPLKCSEKDCKNKAYKKNFLTKDNYHWVCRTHYYMYSYGIDINNKAQKFNSICCKCSRKLDKENVKGYCIKCIDRKNEVHPFWKGNNVSYAGLHKWLKENNKRPLICEQCGSNKFIEFANISGKYKRDLKDYFILCVSCHKKFDKDKKYICPKCGGFHSFWKCYNFDLKEFIQQIKELK